MTEGAPPLKATSPEKLAAMRAAIAEAERVRQGARNAKAIELAEQNARGKERSGSKAEKQARAAERAERAVEIDRDAREAFSAWCRVSSALVEMLSDTELEELRSLHWRAAHGGISISAFRLAVQNYRATYLPSPTADGDARWRDQLNDRRLSSSPPRNGW